MPTDSDELVAELRENFPHRYAIAVGAIRAAVGKKNASPYAKLREIQTILAALDVVITEKFGRRTDETR